MSSPPSTPYGRTAERKAKAEAEADRCARRAAYWMGRFLDARKRAARCAARMERDELAAVGEELAGALLDPQEGKDNP
jgi:hypothetical protein